jgi:hypothetical protein
VWNQTTDKGPWALARQVAGLLHLWWRGDRIRVAPDQGRLLGLRPPCHLIISGRPVEVIGRQVRHETGRATVVYSCQGGTGLGLLVVALVDNAPALDIVWQEGAEVMRLLDADVEVFSSQGLACHD